MQQEQQPLSQQINRYKKKKKDERRQGGPLGLLDIDMTVKNVRLFEILPKIWNGKALSGVPTFETPNHF